MNSSTPIELHADSVMDILAAQCADLETLLELARRETEAAERLDFEAVMRIVGERASLGERLEVYHRQIAEMRQRLSEPVETALRGRVAGRAVELALDIQRQDAHTRPLLMAARSETAANLSRLNKGQRNINGYLRDARSGAVACDQVI